MTPEKVKALLKARDLLEAAWLEIRRVSRDEMEGEFYDLRMMINQTEVKIIDIKNNNGL